MIFLIHGEDDFQSLEKLRFLKNGFIKKYGDLNISVYGEDSPDINKIYNDAVSIPFLSEKKMIVLEKLWSKWGKDDKKKIVDILPKIPETTVLLFFEDKNLVEKKAKSKDLAELIKNIPSQNVFDFNKMNEREISQFINKKVKEDGYNIDYQAINTLSTLVGNNSRQIDQEIKKLMAYRFNDKNIRNEDVLKIVKANVNVNIFNLTDALAKKDIKNSQRIINGLIDSGENIISILSMIGTQFHNLILIKLGEEEKISKETVISETKMHPYVYQKNFGQIRNFSWEKIREIYQEILEADTAIKTGKKDAGLAIDMLITKICL